MARIDAHLHVFAKQSKEFPREESALAPCDSDRFVRFGVVVAVEAAGDDRDARRTCLALRPFQIVTLRATT